MNLRRVISLKPRIRRGAAVFAWRAGQVVCGLCCLGAVLVLIHPPFGRAEQVCVAALLLLGVVALIAGRAVVRFANRRPRRRFTVY